jgi:hypothetical protein
LLPGVPFPFPFYIKTIANNDHFTLGMAQKLPESLPAACGGPAILAAHEPLHPCGCHRAAARHHTFLWHDYETFGADTRRDRPAQFAAIRTDAS